MTTKNLLTIAIIAALPLMAHAENISGAMYIAPAQYDNDHPRPMAGEGPYGRINIDTADQEHIATTAYVKGAYNSAIAAVNNLDEKLNFDRLHLEGSYSRISALETNLSSKRINIYTTWDTTDIIQIPLSDQIIQVELD